MNPIRERQEEHGVTIDDVVNDDSRKQPRYDFDRHTAGVPGAIPGHRRGDAREVPSRLERHLWRLLDGRWQRCGVRAGALSARVE